LACAEHNIVDAAGDATTGPVPSDSDVNADITEVEPNVDIPDAFANIIIEEQANISICSDHWRNPSSPDYDLKVPPATFNKAMLHSDWGEWLSTMQVELGIMKEMNVYCVVPLPEGHKVIRNRWVLEFKQDNKGGLVYKVCLVAQGCSQIPGVDFGATFAPILKTLSIHLISALACKNNWELDNFDAK
jgi:hypothetical protein